MIPLLTYRFNLMATRLRAKAELQKIAAFTAIEKEDFISKKIVAFHFNKQPFLSTAGLVQNRLTIGPICRSTL
jgi:hypothetical protein